MDIEVARKLFTVEEYYRMAEAGIFGPEERVELIDGEVIEMSPLGHRHMVSVNLITDLFTSRFRGKAIVSVQNSLELNKYNAPQPDIVLLKYRPDFYRAFRFTGKDVLMVVEVSDSSLRFDIKKKLPRYADAGIPEVWIENLQADELHIHRNLVDNAYTISQTFRRGDIVRVDAFPDAPFHVDDILG